MINNFKKITCLKKIILILFITLVSLLTNPISVYAKDKVNIYFFNGEGCSHCEKFKTWIDEIKPEYGDLFELKEYETWSNEENAKLMNKVADIRGEEVEGVPYIVIGERSWIGFHESYTSEMITTIKSEFEKDSSERYDVMNLVNGNNSNQKTDSSLNNIEDESNGDNSSISALLIIIGIGVIILAIALIPKYNKVKNDEKEKEKFIRMTIFGTGMAVVVVVMFLLFNSDTDSGSGSSSNVIKDVTGLVESNSSDVNRELGVYILGASGSIEKVNSSNCSIKDQDDYGRYALYCSIDYSGYTNGSGILKSGTGSVYVGYLNTGDGKFNYKIVATHYSNGDALDYLKSRICWNSNSLDMLCN